MAIKQKARRFRRAFRLYPLGYQKLIFSLTMPIMSVGALF